MALLLDDLQRRPQLLLDTFRNPDAAAASYDQILGFLRTLGEHRARGRRSSSRSAPGSPDRGSTATRIREGVKKIGSGDESEAIQQSSIGRFVSGHKTLLRAIVIGLALLVLVVLSAVTPLTVLVIAVLAVVALVLIEFLGRGTPIET